MKNNDKLDNFPEDHLAKVFGQLMIQAQPSNHDLQIKVDEFNKIKNQVQKLNEIVNKEIKDYRSLEVNFEQRLNNERINTITLFSIFSAFIAFITSEIQIFKIFDNPLILTAVTAIFIAGIVIFVLLIDYVRQPNSKIWIWLTVLTLITVAIVCFNMNNHQSSASIKEAYHQREFIQDQKIIKKKVNSNIDIKQTQNDK